MDRFANADFYPNEKSCYSRKKQLIRGAASSPHPKTKKKKTWQMFSLGTSGFTKSLNGVITRGLFSLCWCVGVVFSVAFAVVCLYIFSLISSVCLLKAKRRSLKIWDILQVTGLCACADGGRLCCAVIKCTHTHTPVYMQPQWLPQGLLYPKC